MDSKLFFITIWCIFKCFIQSASTSCSKNESVSSYFKFSRSEYSVWFTLNRFPSNCMPKSEQIIDLAQFLTQKDENVELILTNTNINAVEFYLVKNSTSNEIYFDLFLLDHQNSSLTIRSIHLVKNIHLDQNQIKYFSSYENVSKEDPLLASHKRYPQRLYLNFNSIPTLNGSNCFKNFSLFKRIYYLELSYNKIEEIGENCFQGLVELWILYLSGNRLKIIRANQFDGLINLGELYLVNNQINTIEDKAFFGLPKLRVLDLTRNQLKVLNPNAYENNNLIETVFFSVNDLIDFEETFFAKFKRIVFITWIENKLKIIRKNVFVNNSNLFILNLNSNQIEIIEDDAFVNCFNLNQLTLTGNGLRAINRRTFVGLISLNELYLESNQIESIQDESFTDLQNVFILILTDNRLRNISRDSFKGLKKLSMLFLTRNEIEHIDKDAFSHLIKLFGVDMNQNKIKAISKQDSLFNLPKLEYVNLNDNPIGRFEAGSFDNVTKKAIEFSFDLNRFEIVDGNYDKIGFCDLRRFENLF